MHTSLKLESQEQQKRTEQKIFHILVVSDLFILNKDKADLWNSGKIESSASIHVSYQGKTLKSELTFYWKVRVWEKSRNVSPWSQIAEFSVGLLNKADWKVSYIGFKTDAGCCECPQLKKSFD